MQIFSHDKRAISVINPLLKWAKKQAKLIILENNTSCGALVWNSARTWLWVLPCRERDSAKSTRSTESNAAFGSRKSTAKTACRAFQHIPKMCHKVMIWTIQPRRGRKSLRLFMSSATSKYRRIWKQEIMNALPVAWSSSKGLLKFMNFNWTEKRQRLSAFITRALSG